MTTTAIKERPILFSGEMIRAILDGRKTQTRRVVKPQPSEGRTVDMCHYSKTGWAQADDPKLVRPAGCYCGDEVTCPYGKPGDRLWVRETWGQFDDDHWYDTGRPRDILCERAVRVNGIWHPVRNACYYKADCVTEESDQARRDYGYKYTPSIHMPRWASRITLQIKDVRVERVQEISEEDAKAEGTDCRSDLAWSNGGFDGTAEGPYEWAVEHGHQYAFQELWDSINGDRDGCSWAANPWVWVVEFERVSR